MHLLHCLFDNPGSLGTEEGFLARLPKDKWSDWGSELIEFKSETHHSAYLSDSEDGLGLALIMERVASPEGDALEIVGVMPVLVTGVSMEVEMLDHAADEETKGAGEITVLTERRRELVLCDPDYAEHRQILRNGAHYKIELCGWVDSIAAQVESFAISEGPALEREKARRSQEEPGFDPASLTKLSYSMANMRSLLEAEEPGKYEFITRIENLREAKFDGRRGWLFEGVVENSDGFPALRVAFGMMQHRALDGLVPENGMLVSGYVFLQALIKEEVPHEGLPWADRPAESDFMWANILASLQTGDSFQGTPPAIHLTARVLSQNGWQVSSPPGWRGQPLDHPPLLVIHRGDEQFLVALAVNDESALHGDITLPVQCARQGDGHEIKIDHEHPSAKTLQLESVQVWVADRVTSTDT
ncbi:MAG: hypothetical protein JNM65_12790 [Verrucomicrobiaceae bacterium]|nr:hypothetical protein [Verrucomicrobiaceae bacterium]